MPEADRSDRAGGPAQPPRLRAGAGRLDPRNHDGSRSRPDWLNRTRLRWLGLTFALIVILNGLIAGVSAPIGDWWRSLLVGFGPALALGGLFVALMRLASRGSRGQTPDSTRRPRLTSRHGQHHRQT